MGGDAVVRCTKSGELRNGTGCSEYALLQPPNLGSISLPHLRSIGYIGLVDHIIIPISKTNLVMELRGLDLYRSGPGGSRKYCRRVLGVEPSSTAAAGEGTLVKVIYARLPLSWASSPSLLWSPSYSRDVDATGS